LVGQPPQLPTLQQQQPPTTPASVQQHPFQHGPASSHHQQHTLSQMDGQPPPLFYLSFSFPLSLNAKQAEDAD
jgi:hypothetical protein